MAAICTSPAGLLVMVGDSFFLMSVGPIAMMHSFVAAAARLPAVVQSRACL
jgi:hypothetical protein